jgi:hypothetical protein
MLVRKARKDTSTSTSHSEKHYAMKLDLLLMLPYGITIIISAIILVGMVALAVNNSPAPADAKQCWLRPGSGGFPCYPNRHEYGQSLPPDAVVTCHRKTV